MALTCWLQVKYCTTQRWNEKLIFSPVIGAHGWFGSSLSKLVQWHLRIWTTQFRLSASRQRCHAQAMARPVHGHSAELSGAAQKWSFRISDCHDSRETSFPEWQSRWTLLNTSLEMHNSHWYDSTRARGLECMRLHGEKNECILRTIDPEWK